MQMKHACKRCNGTGAYYIFWKCKECNGSGIIKPPGCKPKAPPPPQKVKNNVY